MKTKFIKISILERKPEINKKVIGIWESGESTNVALQESGYWYSFEMECECDEPEYWLEEVPNKEPEMLNALERIYYTSEDKGIPGCTWGDTEMSSIDVAYGYNLALEHVKNGLEKFITNQ